MGAVMRRWLLRADPFMVVFLLTLASGILLGVLFGWMVATVVR